MSRRLPFLAFILSLTLSGCGSVFDKDENSSQNLKSTTAKALLFTSSDVSFSSSQLFKMDYSVAQIDQAVVGDPLLSGSGDMVLFQDSGRVFLFNRRAEDSNFRLVTAQKVDDGYKWQLGTQLKSPSKIAGDPHDIVVLDDETMLVANYIEGQLVEANFRTGKIEQAGIIPEGLSDNQPFWPKSLLKLNDNQVAVLHQGYDRDYNINRTQAVFLYERREPGVWRQIDMNKDKAGKQGVALQVSTPEGLYQLNEHKIATVGICLASKKDCVSGVEVIDLEKQTSEVTLPLSKKQLSYFGPPIAISNGELAASVLYGDDDTAAPRLMRFDADEGVTSTLYKYPAHELSGYWGYQADPAGQMMFIANASKQGAGQLSAIHLETKQIQLELTLDLVPYSMISVVADEIAK